MLKDLGVSVFCIGLAGVALSSCASLPDAGSLMSSGLMRSSLASIEESTADSVVAKTTHARLQVLPATLDVGGPLLSSKDLRRGQDLTTQPLDAQIVLDRFSVQARPAPGFDDAMAQRRLDDGIEVAAVGTPRIVRAKRRLQCVPFARELSGIEIYGNANRWWDLAEGRYQKANSPTAGSVLVMKGYRTTRRGHVAVVRQIVDERTIIVDHSNWLNDGKIYLSAPIRDVSDDNDWSRVQVWYTPGQQWGSRTYSARGFIRPKTSIVASAN